MNKILTDSVLEMQKVFIEEKNKIEYFSKKMKETKISYGKYKGRLYSQIPKHYIEWYGKNKETSKSDFSDYFLNGLSQLLLNRPIKKKVEDLFIEEI